MRVVVTGGRNYHDSERVFRELDLLHASNLGPITHIAQGGAKGADALASAWALLNGIPDTTYRADWQGKGKFAGPYRNGRMLDEFSPNLVLAFPGGKGTANCMQQAFDRSITVVAIP